MSVRKNSDAFAVTVCGMITGSIHVLGFASSKDVDAVHGTIDIHRKELETVQLYDRHGAVATLAGSPIFALGTRGTRGTEENGEKEGV